jgi:hypothetical protein
MWGLYETPTTSRGNRILNNRIHNFLMELWDGGAIYSLGQQGTSAADGELIAGNVAYGKRPAAGGNIFYTDGGSRYVTLFENVSFDNPVGVSDFGRAGCRRRCRCASSESPNPAAAAHRCRCAGSSCPMAATSAAAFPMAI